MQSRAVWDKKTTKMLKSADLKYVFCDYSETKQVGTTDFWYFFPCGVRIQKMYRWLSQRWGKSGDRGRFDFETCAQSDKRNFPKIFFWDCHLLVHLKRWIFTKFDSLITLGSSDIALSSLLEIGPFPPGKTSNGCHGRVWRVTKFFLPPNIIPWWVLLELGIKKISVPKSVEQIW